jgi:hypothetical protein
MRGFTQYPQHITLGRIAKSPDDIDIENIH